MKIIFRWLPDLIFSWDRVRNSAADLLLQICKSEVRSSKVLADAGIEKAWAEEAPADISPLHLASLQYCNSHPSYWDD